MHPHRVCFTCHLSGTLRSSYTIWCFFSSAHSYVVVLCSIAYDVSVQMKRKAGEVRLHIIEEMAGRVTGEIMNIADDDKNNSIEWSEFKKVRNSVTSSTVQPKVFGLSGERVVC